MRNDTDDLISRQPKHTEKRTETRACDLVSRQAVTDTVRKIILGFFSDSDKDGAMNDTEKTLLRVNKSICNGVRELPSAQPEIIRCKDCVKRETCRTTNIWAVAPDDDWFCGDAERRTDEADHRKE